MGTAPAATAPYRITLSNNYTATEFVEAFYDRVSYDARLAHYDALPGAYTVMGTVSPPRPATRTVNATAAQLARVAKVIGGQPFTQDGGARYVGDVDAYTAARLWNDNAHGSVWLECVNAGVVRVLCERKV